MIPQLYPESDAKEHEVALDRTLDGRHAEVLAKRRRYVDASPLAQWISGRGRLVELRTSLLDPGVPLAGE